MCCSFSDISFNLSSALRAWRLIASRHRHAAGDWEAYEEQQAFTMREGPELPGIVFTGIACL